MIVVAMAAVCTIFSFVGGVAVKWILNEISRGDSKSADALNALGNAIDGEKKTFQDQLDQRHRNADIQFEAIKVALEKTTDKLERLTNDNARMNEIIRATQEQTREIKQEMRDSVTTIRTTVETQLEKFGAAQAAQFHDMALSIREIRESKTRL